MTTKMSTPSLVKAIKSAAEIKVEYKGISFSLEEALTSEILDIRFEASGKLSEAAINLAKAVEQDKRFAAAIFSRISYDAAGNVALGAKNIASLLIQHTAKFGASAKAIKWMVGILNTKSASATTYDALWGISVDKELQLTDEVRLIPLTAARECPQKLAFTNFQHSKSFLETQLNLSPPVTALAIDHQIEPFAYKYVRKPEKGEQPSNEYIKYANVTSAAEKQHARRQQLLTDTTLVMTLLGPSIPISAAVWFTMQDQNLQFALERIATLKMIRAVEILPARQMAYKIDSDAALKLVKNFFALDEHSKKRVRLALKRLNASQRRQSVGDMALELAIAFESLLGDGVPTEMTNKIATRSARLLGGELADRKLSAKIVKEMYRLRSAIVHTGEEPTKAIDLGDERVRPVELLEKATYRFVKICTKLIAEGVPPNWGDWDLAEQLQLQ
ncbi:HEPN domain-containing protein [Burkholderia ubonensis]|uniref:HEPN domain-containing protein n=1 Tax=Burkholderia ubonensis TaxID=101571 RepID=UPI000758F3B2|nr:HEPN domain-containing protein [Burkholderia ubonensis]KVP66097.1 hypothetical protein WJ90_21875 [Burkholderia ubonensis]KVR50193.1 hypothetical protein WK16_31720 [Burkholderia ubonensis]OJB15396.1 hypothetical protein BGV48_10725 [Burkholderia ubonensis]